METINAIPFREGAVIEQVSSIDSELFIGHQFDARGELIEQVIGVLGEGQYEEYDYYTVSERSPWKLW